MDEPKSKSEALQLLATAFRASDQLRARKGLPRDETYYRDILKTYLTNPFLRLTEDEREALTRVEPKALGQLIAARDAASRSSAPRYIVFCMPKSGSSFVQTALTEAFGLPFVTLTSFGSAGQASHFGMNPREQELDEMAVVRSILMYSDGFVAQHHTRYTFYLALQARLFGLTPIVTVRNVFDCIVSFDDMMMDWRRGQTGAPWMADAQFALPDDYLNLAPERRYAILAPSFGVWLINFYLSWKRGRAQRFVEPVVIRYEDHVLAPDRLVETLTDALKLTPDQTARLAAYAARPDKKRARLNVGRRGRGAEQIPEATRAFLRDYAAAFRPDLDDEELAYLVG